MEYALPGRPVPGLSEDARKRYALLQTPEFVEEFILDRSLEPAIAVFGLRDVRLIDPTCGSGHFLLGAFQRLLDRWLHIEPGTAERELVQRALDAVYGVDVNPYAVAIARFRLLVAALQASRLTTLRQAPGFRINVAAGDSLLHGRRFEELDLKGETRQSGRAEGLRHAYGVEDPEELNRILGQQYHAEVFFPCIDLTHVIDTSGAYIPGHGTPTVILFGRCRTPVSDHVRAVLGIQRRWNTEPWEEQEKRVVRPWLLDRLESDHYWPEPQLRTTRTLADQAQFDSDFMQVAELYRGYAGFDVPALVAELVEAEAVPFLPVLRYKAAGLRKREIWERTWELQRREDAIDADVAATMTRHMDESAEQFQARLAAAQRRRKQEDIGDIPPPPKYTAADFHNATCWRLRGSLDVPKERFISYPGCSRAHDPTLVIAWAGWDHLQQARALAAWYTEMVEQEGWAVDCVTPLLAGIAELIQWLKQWHNDIDPDYHERMGDFFEIFLHGQLQQCGLTREDLRGWTPPTRTRTRGRRT